MLKRRGARWCAITLANPSAAAIVRGMGWLLFFDGDCGFCSKSVRWVARHDPRGRVNFAPLQGALAAELGLGRFAEVADGSMVVVRESDGRKFFRSDALIELAGALGGGWRLFRIARVIPGFLRDGVYRWVARNRHRLAGTSVACGLPDPELLKRLRE